MKRSGLIYTFLKKCEHPQNCWFWHMMNSFFILGMIHVGKLVYRKIKRRFENHQIIISPTTDLGDQLFFRMFFEEFVKVNEIDEYVLLFDKRNQRCVETMEFGCCCFLDAKEISALTMYYHSQIDRLADVTDCYPWVLYDFSHLSLKLNHKFPQFPVEEQKIAERMKELGLIPGKTVVLSPYEQGITAMGLPVLALDFWEQLAKQLVFKGYCVCTNCKGTSEQPTIPDTKALFPLPAEMQGYIEQAGIFIGVRSGLVDFISQSKAKMIILYPDEKYYHKWSLVKMKLNNFAVEIIYGSKEIHSLQEEILSYIEQLSFQSLIS